MNTTYVLIGIVAVIAVWLVWAYNNFVRLTNRSEEAWSDIDVQLKRRYDLIPNLIETVKGYAAHEAGTLQKVTPTSRPIPISWNSSANSRIPRTKFRRRVASTIQWYKTSKMRLSNSRRTSSAARSDSRRTNSSNSERTNR